MMTLSSMLMTKALICGIAFIKIPIPSSPSSSAASSKAISSDLTVFFSGACPTSFGVGFSEYSSIMRRTIASMASVLTGDG